MSKTLEEYIQMYEKHTGEKFQFNTGFSFFYEPEHGLCEYKIEDTGLYFWQMCGDLKYWVDIGYKVCQQFELSSMSAYILRKPKPFIRALGFKIESEEYKDGYRRYHCINKAGEKLTATQYGKKYIFVWRIRGGKTMNDFKFNLQLFGGGGGKGGGGSSSSSSYTPSPQELQIMEYMKDNAANAQTGITSMLNQFNTGVKSDAFNNLLGQSSGMIQSGQNTYSDLLNGKLPTAYTENMADAIKSGVNSTVGSNITSLANRGVLNSSVTNKALNDVEGNVANAMAQNYNQNVSQLGNLAGQQIQAATAGYQPYSTLAQLAQGQANTFINSPVSALRGSGTSNTKSNDGSGSPLLNAGLGLATGWVGKQMGLGFF